MQKIKVLHVLDELNTGGAEKIVFSYYENFDLEQFHWEFLITKNDYGKKGMLEESIETMGGKIHRITRKRKGYLKHLVEAFHVIKNGKYDIIHSHLDELSFFYLLFGAIFGVKVRIAHGHLAEANRGRGVELLCKFLKPLLPMVVTNKMACGKAAARFLWGEKALSTGDVHIMNNAIEISKFKFDMQKRESARKKLGCEDKTIVGTVGRLSFQKNSVFVIDIFNEHFKMNKKSHLLLVGDGEEENAVKERIAKYQLEEQVTLLGRRDDIGELMMAMDVFVLPSRFEGLPIVLVEAQCSGLPCLVADTVTKEICLSDAVKYLSLEQPVKEWAISILEKTCDERVEDFQLVENAGYKIQLEAKKMEKYYMKNLSR